MPDHKEVIIIESAITRSVTRDSAAARISVIDSEIVQAVTLQSAANIVTEPDLHSA